MGDWDIMRHHKNAQEVLIKASDDLMIIMHNASREHDNLLCCVVNCAWGKVQDALLTLNSQVAVIETVERHKVDTDEEIRQMKYNTNDD